MAHRSGTSRPAAAALTTLDHTQLTDVEQEINGLLTYDRRPKADPAELAKIIGQN